uniref:Uncharacterized protein n=1 Tax=Anguilla anguilla TaxID=7936 RepID=A0A0E9WA74_ANGAN
MRTYKIHPITNGFYVQESAQVICQYVFLQQLKSDCFKNKSSPALQIITYSQVMSNCSTGHE